MTAAAAAVAAAARKKTKLGFDGLNFVFHNFVHRIQDTLDATAMYIWTVPCVERGSARGQAFVKQTNEVACRRE